VPDSPENDWRLIGFTSEVEFVESSADWERATTALQQVVDSFRAIGPVAGETTRSIEALAPLVEEPMISLRQAGYPRWDQYNTYWFDAYGIYDFNGGVCFVCNSQTARMDILLNKYFCNSSECNASLTTSR
jgi:hypothetical protein